jgi:predicted secreted protein
MQRTVIESSVQFDSPGVISSPIRFIFSRNVLRRNLLIALIVGCILSLANQYDVIARTTINATLVLKIFFNFLVPFIVSSASAAVNRERSGRAA